MVSIANDVLKMPEAPHGLDWKVTIEGTYVHVKLVCKFTGDTKAAETYRLPIDHSGIDPATAAYYVVATAGRVLNDFNRARDVSDLLGVPVKSW